jgi:uncharacterized protein
MSEDLYVSPCIQVCKIGQNRTCTGCDRTIDEITEWASYTHEKRMEIMGRLGYGKRKKRGY